MLRKVYDLCKKGKKGRKPFYEEADI